MLLFSTPSSLACGGGQNQASWFISQWKPSISFNFISIAYHHGTYRCLEWSWTTNEFNVDVARTTGYSIFGHETSPFAIRYSQGKRVAQPATRENKWRWVWVLSQSIKTTLKHIETLKLRQTVAGPALPTWTVRLHSPHQPSEFVCHASVERLKVGAVGGTCWSSRIRVAFGEICEGDGL